MYSKSLKSKGWVCLGCVVRQEKGFCLMDSVGRFYESYVSFLPLCFISKIREENSLWFLIFLSF